MALNKPRISNRTEPFTSQTDETTIMTITDPERAVLASLEQLCSINYADEILLEKHLIRDKKTRKVVARDLSIYIQQALEFYRAAENTKSTTAPLFYYYAFLNLAKALSGIKYPRFLKRSENYHHGVSWKPDRKFYVDIWWDKVRLTGRGVWHTLFEAVTGYACPARQNQKLRIETLFGLCPEITAEFERTIFYRKDLTLALVSPTIYADKTKKIAWIGFYISDISLKNAFLTKQKLLEILSQGGHKYRQVYSDKPGYYRFELIFPKKYKKNDNLRVILNEEFSDLNLFTNLWENKIQYYITIQDRLPFRLPQIMVLYSLMFWLGSFVRYDAHSVIELKKSKYWFLIDGFLNESRIWLLEQFEWYFYKTETLLLSAR